MTFSTFKERHAPLARSSTLLRRTPLARGNSKLVTKTPLARSIKAMAPLGQRAKRTRQGKVAPTAIEAAWMAAASTFCIVCFQQWRARVPAEVHHIKEGERRAGHLFTIGLCHAHHQGGAGDGPYISRHPWKKRFVAAYGSEYLLLEQQRALLLAQPGHGLALDAAGELIISTNR